MNKEIALIRSTTKMADNAIGLREQMMLLRKEILKNIRTVVKPNLELFERDDYTRRMVSKMRRGYFGTDTRTEQLPHLLERILVVLERTQDAT